MLAQVPVDRDAQADGGVGCIAGEPTTLEVQPIAGVVRHKVQVSVAVESNKAVEDSGIAADFLP